MGILDQWQDRWEFAAYNHEQRFQTKLVTKRRFFNAVVSFPLVRIQNQLLRKDVSTKGFDAAAFRFVDDVLISAGGGQMLRSFAFAYGKHKDYRDVLTTSRVLEGFGMMAESHDDSPTKLGEEIAAGKAGVMHDLITHSGEASDLLDQFVHGDMDLSPSNVAKLEKHLHAMAELCDEKAELLKYAQDARDPSKAQEGEESTATDYIRDVLRADEISTGREAQIMAGFVAAVLADAATPLGTEIYVPQDQTFLEPKDAKEFAGYIESQLDKRGFVPNVSLKVNEPRPFEDLPEGAMIRKGKDGQLEKIFQEEMLEFANTMHGHLKDKLGEKLENMLGFIDSNFQDVQASIGRSQEDPTPTSLPVWNSGQQHSPGDLDKSLHWETEQGITPRRVLQGIDQVVRGGAKHLSRPQVMHENKKLFGRAIAGQLVSYPIKIFDEAMKSFFRDDKGYDILKGQMKAQGMRGRFGGIFNRGEDGKEARADFREAIRESDDLIDMEDLIGNMKSSSMRLLTAPLAASFGTVFSQEIYHLPRGVAVEAAGRAGKVLSGAIISGHEHAPQVAARMREVDGLHPSLKAVLESEQYKDDIPRILKTPAGDRSDDDYKLLGKYYRDLSDICVSTAEEALSSYGVGVTPDKIDSMDDIVTRTLRQQVQTAPDAMIAIAFVQSVLEVTADKTASMEYVDPSEIAIKHREMYKFANFVEEQAKAAGLTIAKGDEGEGIVRGQMLEVNAESGKKEPVSEETLVRFANVMTSELKQYVQIDNLLGLLHSKERDEYLDPVEQKVFGASELAEASRQQNGEEAAAENGAVQPELTQTWEGKVTRQKRGVVANSRNNVTQPEVKHEIKKLLGRSLGETVSAFYPGLIYNSLQHNEKIHSRAGIISGFYKSGIYPLLYSYGLVSAKEAMTEMVSKKGHIIHESDVSQSLLEGAITAAGSADSALRERMIDATQHNADLLAVEDRKEFRDIPRIAAKPRDERTEQDTELMGRFCDELGVQMLDNTTRIFAAAGSGQVGESITETMERVLEQPVDNLGDAVVAIGFLHSAIKHNADFLDVLTYISPEERVMDRKQVRELTEFMNDQASIAGFAVHGVSVKGKDGNEFTVTGEGADLQEGELLQWNDDTQAYERASSESIIRYANVSAAKLRDVLQERVKDEGKESLVARYQNETKGEIFTRL